MSWHNNGMKRFNVRLEDREHADLKLYCLIFDKSMNQVVRSLIEKFVAESKPKIKKAMQKRTLGEFDGI